ncbi:urease accessory protein D isoform X2 [Salvia miltiorrhiza]|uniref:urease accessory protein D isoform X2 n=1 Tax=Salvia miltiorrhiza TaxID=226208 RepID=UPI0025ACEE3B|nr:urease accessory protein D isoform X2 [Salvia miltiorrhiza]
MERGKLIVERVEGKSTLTRCFSKYPFKFIVPKKVAFSILFRLKIVSPFSNIVSFQHQVGSSQTDAVWIYTITYGGGIVSGDSIAFDVTVADGCNAVLTTQSSTKVYKSIESKCSEQVLEASIGQDALLVVIPDPVTCFSTARYSQTQNFKLVTDSSLLLVDWITSGRHERGEKWAFSHYKSTNRILLQPTQPLFLDTILLEQGSHGSIADRMNDYQAIAMIVLLGPKLKHIQNQIEEDVRKIMSQRPSISSSKPNFIASCSRFGPKGMGVVIRVASTTTEAIYNFLQHQLATMEELLGAPPYR